MTPWWLKPCPINKIRSPSTHRCRSPRTVSRSPCKHRDKHGRCIRSPVSSANWWQTPCKGNRVRNPDTRRCISPKSPRVRKLSKTKRT